ncbi:Glycosyltransferase involved in cell wall bisynthesis [Pseudomonas delhiensis]|uniref:Glycosyltransferase involved in cell wall bisynthesis n=1 Tax=Pseudomonas delhiensis TaxID=366289 RepID=A0A239G8R2_9PSED|nr:glycosyltransferase family 2 protein [Pseudomonas delhiensis]SDK54705.1 Glycosyltransferase involved in cell wall bisynthesis [Pseudomonas delhiensis]SNS65500.1 Glycosyltransferase involved in cell wall bisynthesis [Pseudomonas delhiensis]
MQNIEDGLGKLSIILPAKNEAEGLSLILPRLKILYPDAEIIVVDDGSNDRTEEVCESLQVSRIFHHYSKGNGAAIKAGLRRATGDTVVCMDADGQHRPEDIHILLDKMAQGYDMVVGARRRSGQASGHRGLANAFYNRLASWMVGQQVDDLTSGFRAMRRLLVEEFISLLPNGFSYPTTTTMCFFRAGYSVAYVPVDVQQRLAGTQSHIRLIRDGIRFLMIIFKIGTLYSPLKIFLPISGSLFLLGLGYYLYTFIEYSRFTNMSALLFTTSIMVFLMGLVSEQITNLLYSRAGE